MYSVAQRHAESCSCECGAGSGLVGLSGVMQASHRCQQLTTASCASVDTGVCTGANSRQQRHARTQVSAQVPTADNSAKHARQQPTIVSCTCHMHPTTPPSATFHIYSLISGSGRSRRGPPEHCVPPVFASVPPVYRLRTVRVPPADFECTASRLQMYYQQTSNVPPADFKCTARGLQMYRQRTSNVLPADFKCTASGLQMHCAVNCASSHAPLLHSDVHAVPGIVDDAPAAPQGQCASGSECSLIANKADHDSRS
jgi:hypothetical protein